MDSNIIPAVPLSIHSSKEKYGWTFTASIAIHVVLILLLFYGGYFYQKSVMTIGTGPGGGQGGESYTVGMVEELSGGVGMTKASLVPKPPALVEKEPPKTKSKVIPLPESKETKKRKLTDREIKQAKQAPQDSNIIPTAPEPGSGGAGGSSGSGGGIGGGIGISIGSGSGGFGNPVLASYARTVEERISRSWTRPEGRRVEMIYSFYIFPDGSIHTVKQERSSGDSNMDLQAERAINSLNFPRLPPPPAEAGRRLIRFEARFIYPPRQ